MRERLTVGGCAVPLRERLTVGGCVVSWRDRLTVSGGVVPLRFVLLCGLCLCHHSCPARLRGSVVVLRFPKPNGFGQPPVLLSSSTLLRTHAPQNDKEDQDDQS